MATNINNIKGNVGVIRKNNDDLKNVKAIEDLPNDDINNCKIDLFI